MNREFAYSFMEYQKTGNFWCDLYPITKLTVCMLMGITTIIAMNWKYGFSMCALYILFALFTRKFKGFWKTFKPLALLIILSSVFIRQLSYTGTDGIALFSVLGWTWYKEPLFTALNVSSYLVGFSGALLIYFQTTEMRDLMYSFEKMGMSHSASYIMLAALQCIIDLRKSADTIFESQKSRGIETEGKLLTRVKAFIPALGPVVLGALSEVEEKTVAMDARAFSVERKHTFLREIEPMKVVDFMWIGLSVIYFSAIIILRVLHFF